MTKKSFIGDYQPINYDYNYSTFVSIHADYKATVSISHEMPDGTIVYAEWEGPLSFSSDSKATLDIVQDGRKGTITFTPKGFGIILDIKLEKATDDSPYTGDLHIIIPSWDKITEPMRMTAYGQL